MKTEDVKPNTKRQRHQDRVTLDQESLQRVDGWIEQVTSNAKGVNVARKEVVNWLIKQHDEHLLPIELDELKSKYFSDVRFLQQAIRELKAAKQRGEPITLGEIFGAATPKLGTAPVRRRRSRRKEATPEGGAMVSEIIDGSSMANVLE